MQIDEIENAFFSAIVNPALRRAIKFLISGGIYGLIMDVTHPSL